MIFAVGFAAWISSWNFFMLAGKWTTSTDRSRMMRCPYTNFGSNSVASLKVLHDRSFPWNLITKLENASSFTSSDVETWSFHVSSDTLSGFMMVNSPDHPCSVDFTPNVCFVAMLVPFHVGNPMLPGPMLSNNVGTSMFHPTSMIQHGQSNMECQYACKLFSPILAKCCVDNTF